MNLSSPRLGAFPPPTSSRAHSCCPWTGGGGRGGGAVREGVTRCVCGGGGVPAQTGCGGTGPWLDRDTKRHKGEAEVGGEGVGWGGAGEGGGASKKGGLDRRPLERGVRSFERDRDTEREGQGQGKAQWPILPGAGRGPLVCGGQGVEGAVPRDAMQGKRQGERGRENTHQTKTHTIDPARPSHFFLLFFFIPASSNGIFECQHHRGAAPARHRASWPPTS